MYLHEQLNVHSYIDFGLPIFSSMEKIVTHLSKPCLFTILDHQHLMCDWSRIHVIGYNSCCQSRETLTSLSFIVSLNI